LELNPNVLVNGAEIFMIVFVRMVGLFVVAPIFGRNNVPAYMKIGFSLLVTLIMVNVIEFKKIDFGTSILSYSFYAGIEFIIGMIIGYVSYLIFSAIYLAGQLIDMQIGFGIVNVLDPLSNIQVPITSNFYMLLATLLFLIIDGHHTLVAAIYESYKYIPIGQGVFSTKLMNNILQLIGNIFIMGFKIAAPVTCALLITDVTLGIISRAIPQLNVFMLGFPIKIVLGLGLIIVSIGIFTSLIKDMTVEMAAEIQKVMTNIGGG
jgi:flagellar biosynthesis protein FliR